MPEKGRFPAVLVPATQQDAESKMLVAHTLRGEGFDASEDGTGRQNLVPVAFAFEPGIAKRDGSECRFNKEICPTLRSQMGDNQPAVAFNANARPDEMRFDLHTLTRSRNAAALTTTRVRRLTPTECERLQGFPDGYTDIKPKGKDTPDGPRYKALGNSMAVPVMRRVGERIEMVENIQRRIG